MPGPVSSRDWAITDELGFRWLRLGDLRQDVRARLGEWRTFKRTPSAPETDQFISLGIMVTFDADDRATLIEVGEPGAPTLAGVGLIGRLLDEVAQDLEKAGFTVSRGSFGALIQAWGVGLYSEDGLVVAGVGIGVSA